MRHRKRKVTLDRTAAGRRSLLRTLATNLILYERITTTTGKAKAVRPMVERLVTAGKSNTLASRRRLLAVLPVKSATRKVLEVLSPRYRERHGGYLRITSLGTRRGDGAKLSRVEFI